MRRERAERGSIVTDVAVGVAIGLGLGVLASSSLTVAVVVWLTTTATVAAIACIFVLAAEAPRSVGQTCRDVLGWSVVMSAAMGLLWLSPAAAAPGLVLLAAAPVVRRSFRAWRRALGPSRGLPGRLHPIHYAPLVVTDDVTDADLWRAWQSSQDAVTRSSSPEERLGDAEFRAVLLDELDRRGLGTWADEDDR